MRRFGGAVIRMQQSFDKIKYLVGNEEILKGMEKRCTVQPFSAERIEFLNQVSRALLADREAKQYPDVVTFAFWCRKSSMEKQKMRFALEDDRIFRLGKGIAFHIAPSNVAVNYAYSFVVGFMTGNQNIVRLPSKDFPQVVIINRAIQKALENMPELKQDICFIRYERAKEINDFLSSLADIRIIWGGDRTIQELRKSELKARASEITFADRYSACVIDADAYLRIENKERTAEEFYNDTYLTDQNACTSPRILLWMGKERERAKKEFWSHLYEKVRKEYPFQPIQGMNKLTSLCLLAVGQENTQKEESEDNLLIRVRVEKLTEELMEYRDNSGYFLEYDMEHVKEMIPMCNERLQTVSYIGDAEMFQPLLESGMKGIDRIVPVGSTMDFDFVWDGYDLVERLSRKVAIS